MSKKNKHNQTVGSTVERTDERITETGEVFTPPELCKQMVDEIPLDIIKNHQEAFEIDVLVCNENIDKAISLINIHKPNWIKN